jgi:hypothetical protein
MCGQYLTRHERAAPDIEWDSVIYFACCKLINLKYFPSFSNFFRAVTLDEVFSKIAFDFVFVFCLRDPRPVRVPVCTVNVA